MDEWINSHKEIIYIDAEAQPDHYSWLLSGWYFYDVSGGIVGPYETKQAAKEAREYFFWINKGK